MIEGDEGEEEQMGALVEKYNGRQLAVLVTEDVEEDTDAEQGIHGHFKLVIAHELALLFGLLPVHLASHEHSHDHEDYMEVPGSVEEDSDLLSSSNDDLPSCPIFSARC